MAKKTYSVAETYARRISQKVCGGICYVKINPVDDAWTVYDSDNGISYDCYNDGVRVRFPWGRKPDGAASHRQIAKAYAVLKSQKLVD